MKTRKTNSNRLLRLAVRYARNPLNPRAYLAAAETALILPFNRPTHPPLFIMGLPRSGTTLIYQYIAHRLNVSYFTNGVGKYPHAPCIMTALQRKIYGTYVSDFQSHYGKVKGAVAPREAGGFWGRFFDLEDYVDISDLSPKDIHTLRSTIACIERIFRGVPFVNKNIKHLLRIGCLREIFPNCQLLVVERDRVDVALSLLRGKFDTLEDPQDWLSVRPPDYLALASLPPADQVARQLDSLSVKLEQDLSKIGDGVLRVSYEKFCDDPEHLIEMLEASIGGLEKRNSEQRRFTRSQRKINGEEESRLVQLVKTGRVA